MDYDQSRKAPLQVQAELFDVSALPGRTILVGTCNGLLCFECDHEARVILMNPSTRRFKLSPREDFVGNDDLFMYGFGYDDSGAIDDYKVVRIELVSSNYSVTTMASTYDVKVYSMRTNSWTSVDNSIPYGVQLTGPSAGIFFNGAIHWMTSKSSCWHGIIPYDVKDQEFRQVLLAPYCGYGNGDIWWVTSFWIIMRECLGVIRVYGGVDYEVWVMKEYGRRESWTRQFVLRSPGMNTVYCSMIGNEVLFMNWPRADNTANIGLYETKTDETDIDFKAVHSPIGCAVTTYTESLVSLKSRLKKKKRKSATTYIESFVSIKSKLKKQRS